MLKLIAKSTVAAIFIMAAIAGPGDIEGIVWPVFSDMKIINVELTDDKINGRRLCYDIDLHKQREARGIYYVAQVYQDDQLHPAIRGVTHRDGTPFGLTRAGTPPQKLLVDFCVSIAHMPEQIKRIGVRMHIEWSVKGRPWAVRQPPIWVDYYSEKG